MTTPDSPDPLEQRRHYWQRVLRPLAWWFLLVLVLFAHHTHQRWMEKTRLLFNPTLAGQHLFPEITATLDGQPIYNNQNLSLGRHRFVLQHPKGEPYETNLFIWYGPHDLGTIDLKRTMSVLSLVVKPPAAELYIHGPELNLTLTNTPGMTSSVPTDLYVIMARYAHWSQSDNVLVAPGSPASWQIAPRLGAVSIDCNQADATGQLLQSDGLSVVAGAFPYAVTELPEGNYTVTANHHNNVLSQTVPVTMGTTNQVTVMFLYGSVVLETDPPGASVQTGDGRYCGVTPLSATELKPGDWNFTLQHNGYESVNIKLAITANQTTTLHTNLINVNYTSSMQAARQAMTKADYDLVLKAAGDALIGKPGDAEALSLQRTATGQGSLQRARQLGKQGDFLAGEKELATTLEIFPDQAEAKALLAEYRRREPEQIDRLRLERLERGNTAFKNAWMYKSDADLFASHEFKTAKPVNQVYAAILEALRLAPAFHVTKSFSPAPETYQIEFGQEFSTYLATSAGRRDGIIVCAQTKDDETQILFKLMEYKTEAQNKFSLGNLIGTPVDVNYIPISAARLGPLSEKLQARVTEGVTNVTARIQGAIGATTPPTVQ
ncbi:MAG: PEGA domain-containing protein [Verrucomicrobiota bacterium]